MSHTHPRRGDPLITDQRPSAPMGRGEPEKARSTNTDLPGELAIFRLVPSHDPGGGAGGEGSDAALTGRT